MTTPDDRPEDRQDDLRAHIERLPREVAPRRDLWAGVAQGIAASPRRRAAPKRLAAVSGLALAAALALVVGLRTRPRTPPTYGAAPPTSDAVVVRAAPASTLPGEIVYENAERALTSELDARRTSLPTDETRVLDNNLRLFDDAISSTREAMRAHPDDPELRAELDRVWEDKIDLLRQASELPTEL